MPTALRYTLVLLIGAGLAVAVGQYANGPGAKGLEPSVGTSVGTSANTPANTAPTADPLDTTTYGPATATPEPSDDLEQGAPNTNAPSVVSNKNDGLSASTVASIAQQLQQVDPFIEDLAATNSAANEALAAAPDISKASNSKTAVANLPDASEVVAATTAVLEDEPADANAFELLGERVRSGTRVQLTWNATETLSGRGSAIPTPVLVAHGAEQGPVMCITAGVHGDELNGIETVRRILHSTKPEKLKGTLVGVPIVNLQGFQRQSRYLPDRRDLNRFFPGHPKGSSASRIAHAFFDQVIRHCDALVDLHTGSFHRTNLPQLRADLNNPEVVALSQSFGSTVVLHSEGGVGTLRRAAVEAGIPAVTLEAGEPLRLQVDEVAHSVKGINTLLATRKMYKRRNIWGDSEAVYYTSQWVRADTGGILFSQVDLGKRIKPGELLGTVTDPVSNEREEIRAPFAGRVIGMALNQFVMPGFATFHLGIEADDVDEAKDDDDPTVLSHDVAYEPDMSVDALDATEPTEE